MTLIFIEKGEVKFFFFVKSELIFDLRQIGVTKIILGYGEKHFHFFFFPMVKSVLANLHAFQLIYFPVRSKAAIHFYKAVALLMVLWSSMGFGQDHSHGFPLWKITCA